MLNNHIQCSFYCAVHPRALCFCWVECFTLLDYPTGPRAFSGLFLLISFWSYITFVFFHLSSIMYTLHFLFPICLSCTVFVFQHINLLWHVDLFRFLLFFFFLLSLNLLCLRFDVGPYHRSVMASLNILLSWTLLNTFLHPFPFRNVHILIPDIPSVLSDPPFSSSSASVTLSSSLLLHPLFSSSPPAALHLSVEHRYLFRNLSVEIILHLRRSLSTHNYHGQSCRTALNSAETLMTLLAARPSFHWR